MELTVLDQRQKDYLCAQYDLDRQKLEALLEDLGKFIRETPEDFIRRRHEELKGRAWPNSLIYPQIRKELGQRLFRSEDYTERQIRRQVYG